VGLRAVGRNSMDRQKYYQARIWLTHLSVDPHFGWSATTTVFVFSCYSNIQLLGSFLIKVTESDGPLRVLVSACHNRGWSTACP
jgi:hypothetical protein